jgi:hypothetical protein
LLFHRYQPSVRAALRPRVGKLERIRCTATGS